MTVIDDFTAVESEPTENFELEDVKELTCSNCGDIFFIPSNQRGRRPTKCANCRSQKADSAPKQESAGGPKSSGLGRPSNLNKLEKSLAAQLAGVGSLISLFQPFDGMVIVHNSDDLAAALCKIAERNPNVRKALEQFVASSSYGELAFALFAVAGPILANHDVLPPQVAALGKVPKEAIPYFKPVQRQQAAQESQQNSQFDTEMSY
jgi:hypothetical protein